MEPFCGLNIFIDQDFKLVVFKGKY